MKGGVVQPSNYNFSQARRAVGTGTFHVRLINFPAHKIEIPADIDYGYGPGVIAWLGSVWFVTKDIGSQAWVVLPDSMPSFMVEGTVLTFDHAKVMQSLAEQGSQNGFIRAQLMDTIWQIPYQTELARDSSPFAPIDGVTYNFDVQTGMVTEQEEPGESSGTLVSFAIGKGLKEPCSPYREIMVFGAALNDVPAVIQWNCMPGILNESSVYNLSGLMPEHEVVCALVNFQDLDLSSPLAVRIEWQHKGAALIAFDYSIPAGTYSRYGVFSYIGYVPAEISENGEYSVSLYLGDQKDQEIAFSVSGVGAVAVGSSNKVLWAGAGLAVAAIAWKLFRKKA